MNQPQFSFLHTLVKFLRKDRELLKKMFVFSICLGILELTIPVGVQVIINRISQTLLFDALIVILIMVLAFLIFHAIYLYLRFNLNEYIQRRVFSKVALSLPAELERPDRDMLHGIKFMEVVLFKKNVSKFLTEGLSLILSFTFGTLLIIFYHPFFAFLTILTAVIYLATLYVFHDRLKATTVSESKAKYQVAERMVGLAISKDKSSQNFSELNDNFLKKRVEHFRLLKIQYVIILFIYVCSQVALLSFGSYLTLQGAISIGQLVASELIFSIVLLALAKSIKFIDSYYDLYASVEKLSFIEKVKVVQHPYLNPSAYQKYYRVSLLILCVMPFLMLLLPWVQTAKATGQLTTLDPEERVQEISAFIDGRISKWYVKEGESVKKGQRLAEMVDTDPNFRDRLKTDRDAAFQKYQATKIATETALIDLKRQKKLFEQGLSSRVKYEKAKIDYHNLLAKEAEGASNLAKREVQYSRQERSTITAPSDGVIQQLYSGNLSSSVKKGTRLAVFVPKTSTPAIEMFVDGNDLPLIENGDDVVIEFEGFPALQFSGWPGLGIGLFNGKVTSIDSTIHQNGRFRIMVTPRRSSDWPRDQILRRGTQAIGWVQLGVVSLGYEIWRQLNGFPPINDQTIPKVPKVKK